MQHQSVIYFKIRVWYQMQPAMNYFIMKYIKQIHYMITTDSLYENYPKNLMGIQLETYGCVLSAVATDGLVLSMIMIMMQL